MRRKFKINIDGQEYLVEMEEIGGTTAGVPVQPTVAAAPPPPVETQVIPTETKPEASQPATPAPKSAVGSVTAPMPGTILRLLVKPGDQVAANQPLLILEAMKMENEIVADHDGTVEELFVTHGATVNAGDPLLRLS